MPQAVTQQLELWRLKYAPDLDIALKPIVLTSDQVEKYDLPRIPIKESDRRPEIPLCPFFRGARPADC
jgi:hypothetical protein